MNGHAKIPLTRRLNPAVPRRYLFGLAGVLWTVAGVLLCFRAAVWLDVFSTQNEFAMELAGLSLAAAVYFSLFFRMVQKNIDRILRLPERACIFAFAAWRGYVMIGLMMSIGITLRNTSIPRYYLSIPYTAMGGILLMGSVRFYRQFLQADRGVTS